MDILKTLNEQGNMLLPEDLEYIETELDTAKDYSERYKQACKNKIEQLRKIHRGNKNENNEKNNEKGIPGKLLVSFGTLAPSEAQSLTPDQIIMREISDLRLMEDYNKRIKDYIADHESVDGRFIDRHFSFFCDEELNVILMMRQLGDDMLEKYFGALDRKKIARYQLFSEEFFMKHFSQLDYTIVLQRGKNPWRKKENRSQKLDVFLRLKGVTI